MDYLVSKRSDAVHQCMGHTDWISSGHCYIIARESTVHRDCFFAFEILLLTTGGDTTTIKCLVLRQVNLKIWKRYLCPAELVLEFRNVFKMNGPTCGCFTECRRSLPTVQRLRSVPTCTSEWKTQYCPSLTFRTSTTQHASYARLHYRDISANRTSQTSDQTMSSLPTHYWYVLSLHFGIGPSLSLTATGTKYGSDVSVLRKYFSCWLWTNTFGGPRG